MKISKRVLGAKALLPRGEARLEEPPATRRRTEVSVREAKDQLSALLQRAEAGEEIVITSDGEPKAMLVRFRPTPGGKPWQSLAEFRARQPMQPDSTAAIGEMREGR
ncbi:MAG: type II toxin-antitoxin system Phd/YefM family antitoxin [Verrucomicrobiota bacterium]